MSHDPTGLRSSARAVPARPEACGQGRGGHPLVHCPCPWGHARGRGAQAAEGCPDHDHQS
eukprot:17913-Heterococcus_DN1.PRE.1